MIGRFEEVMIAQIPICHVHGIVHGLGNDVFLCGQRQFVETLQANLENDPEFELDRLSDVAQWYLRKIFPKKLINDVGLNGFRNFQTDNFVTVLF